MKKTLLVLAVVSSNVFAYTEDPHHAFDMTHNEVNSFQVTFQVANDVNAACLAASKKRGGGGFGYRVDACSFWDDTVSGRKCTVITQPSANFHTVGHEIRHCLQGVFHDAWGEIKR